MADLTYELPIEFLERMEVIVPESQWEPFLASFDLPRRVAFRLNPLQGLCELPNLNCEPVSWSPVSFSVAQSDRERLTLLPETTTGQLYLQSLSSQLAAIVLDPNPNEQVLDLAAAPGGKAAHLAALMQNQGLLSCVEPVRNRFFRLQANLRQQGVKIAKFYMTDGRTVGKKVGERFHRVMLDAPCSGEARFTKRDATSFATWSPRKIRETSRKQIGLIKSAFESLQPGGHLLYSTCSFAPEENEGVVQKLLEMFGTRVQVLPLSIDGRTLAEHNVPVQSGLTEFNKKKFSPEIALTQRILPNQVYDGFYLALLQKYNA